jgi:iron complex outermembrane recepter protein
VRTPASSTTYSWTPTERLTIDASATFSQLDAHGSYDTYPTLGAYTYESLTPEGFDDNFKLYNIAADTDFGFAHLITSVTDLDRAFTDYRSFQYFDEYFLTPGILLPTTGLQINTIKDATEEVRLVSNPDEGFRWTIGAFNENYHRNYLQIFDSPGSDAVFATLYGIPGFNSQTQYGTAAPDQTFWGPIDVREHQLALFGEATYEVLPRLDVTLGARYFDFRQNFNLYFTGAFQGPQPAIQNNVAQSSGVNPRAVVSYYVSDAVMVYTEAARGFRYGGSNLPVPVSACGPELEAIGLSQAPETFGPDHLWNYEIGEKGEFFAKRLVFNLTGFFINWQDVQTTHPLACGYPFVQNSGEIESRGLELDSKAKLGDAVTVSLSGSITNATTDGPITNLGAPDGSRAPYFPHTIVTAGVDYVTHLRSGQVRWAADWTYRSYADTQFNLESPLNREIPSSTMLNASITYSVKAWQFGVYGTNLTNNLLISTYEYLQSQYAPYQPGDQRYIGRPRTVGLRLHRDF